MLLKIGAKTTDTPSARMRRTNVNTERWLTSQGSRYELHAVLLMESSG